MDSKCDGLIQVRGIPVRLHPSGALYWPATDSLLLADLHLGKESVFQQAGIPIPSGASESTLRSLESLVDAFQPKQVIVLGDLLHSKVGLTPWLRERLSSMCGRRESIEWILVPGNHDRGGKRGLQACGWRIEGERMEFAGVEMVHAPDRERTSRDALSISGHLHPSIRLGLRSRDKVRLRCFWLTSSQLVLPAFGGWTGTKPIAPSATDRIFACVEREVIEVAPERVHSERL